MWISLSRTLEVYGGRFLRALPSLMPYILVAIGLLVVLILARLFVVLWSKKRVSAPDEAASGEAGGPNGGTEAPPGREVSGIRASFREAMRQLRRLMQRRGYHLDWWVRLTGHGYRYELPWYAMVGEAGGGKSALLENLPLETPVPPLRAEATPEEQHDGCGWWFFNQALVLDVPGAYVHRSEGRTAEEGWTQVLRQLRRYRPRQPLNGIVLALPATDLVGASALSTAGIEAKATRLYNRLQDLQRTVGLRLPVYVVVTKCDTVPGFAPFCRQLSPSKTDEILGWSNPNAIDAAYTSAWLNDAFEGLRENLYAAQIHALSENGRTDERDASFLFPDRVANLKEGLTTYLDQLFTQSVYHEGMILRGVYLTGNQEAGGETESVASGEQPTLPFLKDLFQSKIFKEGALARPSTAAYGWQQRATRAVQGGVVALAILGVLGLWHASSYLNAERDALVPVLQDAQTSIQEVNQWQAAAGRTGQAAGKELRFKKLATSLLQRTGRVVSMDLTSLAVPASWVGSVEETVDRAVATAYEKVILRSMRSALRLRAEALVAGDLRSGRAAAATGDTLTLRALPSYRAWTEYSEDLSALEQAHQWYSGLSSQPDLDHFGRLAEYLFGVRIQRSLERAPEVYRTALGDVQPEAVRLRGYREQATAKMRRHARRFNEALPQRHGTLVRLQELAGAMDRLGTVSVRDDLSIQEEEQQLRSVHAAITQMDRVLERPASRWLTADSLALQRVYGPLLAFSDTSSLVAPGFAARLRAEAPAVIDRVQQKLSNVRSRLTGPLLEQQDGQVRRAWTSEVESLHEALGVLLDQPFMKPVPNPPTLRATPPPGRRLRWNVQELQQIVQHIQVYDSLTTKGLSQFSAPMQRTVQRVASAGLDKHLRRHLGRAQSFALDVPAGTVRRREAQIQRRADRFRKALPSLNTVLTIQGELGTEGAQQALARVVAQEALSIVEATNALLAEENLYGVGPSAFRQWKGTRSPNVAVINARDAQDVRRYLNRQREQLAFLVEEMVGPALSFLAQWDGHLREGGRPVVAKWQGIRRALRGYQNQTAGNTLSVFEDFLLTAMEGVRPTAYVLNTDAERAASRSSDFFLEKRNALRQRLYERSRELALQRVERGYERLASTFNQALQGRFPFAAPADSGSVQEAAPSDVRAFYERYDRYASQYPPVLRQQGLGEKERAFLRRVEALRPFFGAFLDDPTAYPIPTVDVVPTFRVNRERDALGDQVIGWHMRVEGERASYGRRDTLHWAAGDRVSIRLRWAADAPTRPAAAEKGRVVPSARTVTYRYGGQWALLRLLRRHRAPPSSFDRRVDPDPHTLLFAAHAQGQARARLFVRQRLYRPDESTRVVVPSAFPQRAPPLSAPDQPLSRRRP